MNTLSNLSILSLGFLFLFAIGEFLKTYLKVKAEWTRKFVHIGTGLLSLTFPILFENHWFVFLLCFSFLAILLMSQKKKFLNSINGVSRKTCGATLFPVTVYFCFLLQAQTDNILYYSLPILILTLSDPLAAIVGQKFPLGKYNILGHTKTMAASTAFWLSAFGISWSMGIDINSSLLIAFVASIAEAVSKDGYDNLTIPSSVVIVISSLGKSIGC